MHTASLWHWSKHSSETKVAPSRISVVHFECTPSDAIRGSRYNADNKAVMKQPLALHSVVHNQCAAVVTHLLDLIHLPPDVLHLVLEGADFLADGAHLGLVLILQQTHR